MLTCGSAFSGAGLLDYGLHLAGLEHLWLCEADEWRRGQLAKRWPDARIYDDVRHLGHDCEPVGLFAGGFPCKGASTAGKRNGFDHAETVLWREMYRAIRELRPRYVLVENVANLLAIRDGDVWAEVLGDLASLGMDVVWDCLPAASVGATHLRDRVFAVASHPDGTGREGHGSALGVRTQVAGAPADHAGAAADAGQGGWGARQRDVRPGQSDTQGRREAAADADGGGRPREGRRRALEQGQRSTRADDQGRGVAVDWGAYEPAIRRWEAVHGPAPEPLVRRMDDGLPELQRMRSRVDRSRLSALGDGVQVQVGFIAGQYIVDLERGRLT